MGRFSVLVLIVVVVVAQADEQCDDCNKQTWINGADSDPHVAVRLPVRWRAASHYGPELSRIQTVVLGHTVVRSLALLTRLLAPPCSVRSRALLRSLICLLAHFAHSRARGKVNE